MTDRPDVFPIYASRTALQDSRHRWTLFAPAVAIFTVTLILIVSVSHRVSAEEVEQEEELFYDEEEFDQLMLSYKDADEIRAHLKQVLSKEVERIGRFCSLSEIQKTKLLLAGRGDIQWYFDYVAEIRSRYINRALSQAEYRTLLEDTPTRKACMSIAIFGEASILRKTLRNTLSEHQLAQYQNLERERHLNSIEILVRTLERKGREPTAIALPQRRRLVELLTEKTRLPSQSASNLGTNVMLLRQTGQFDVLEIRQLLNDDQWWYFQLEMISAVSFELFLQRTKEWPIRPLEDDSAESESTNQNERIK